MRCAMVLAGVILASAAGCRAPAPLDSRQTEAADARFAPPTPADPSSGVDAILARRELTLEDVLAFADLRNPDLAVERRNIDLATADLWEARLYPNPTAGFELEEVPTHGPDSLGSAKRTGGITMPLVLGGRIGAATSAAEADREVAAITYVWRRREILTQAKVAFFGVLAARRDVELSTEARDIAKTLRDLTQARYDAQAIPEMELLKAGVSLSKAETDLTVARKDLTVAVKTLKALLGDADLAIDRFVGELHLRFDVPDTARGWEVVLAHHPLMEAAKGARRAAELRLSLARAERVPDVDLTLSGGLDAEDEEIVQAGIEVPIPLFNRNQAKIMAAEVRVRQAESGIVAARNRLLLDLTQALAELTTAQERVRAYGEEVVPQAQKALDQTSDGYRQGKFSYLEVLDAQRTLADAKVSYAAALADLNVAAAELEKLSGTRIEVAR